MRRNGAVGLLLMLVGCTGSTVGPSELDASTGGSGALAGAGGGGSGGVAALGGTSGMDAAAGGGGLAGSGGQVGSGGAAGCQAVCATNLVPTTYGALDLAISGVDVYFGNYTSISKVPATGGTPALIASGSFRPPIAIDASSIYVFDDVDYHLKKLPKTGGVPIKVADGEGGPAQRLLLSGGYAYFTVYPSGLYRVPLTGGSAEKLSTEAFPIHDPIGVAADATHVFWSNKAGQSISARPLSGGPAVNLATGLLSPFDLVLDGDDVIFADVNEIYSVPKQGGSLTSLVTSVLPSFLVADATHLYWTSITASRVARAPIQGGPAQPIAKQTKNLSGLALDATHVYFLEEGGIERAAKDCCVL